MSYIKAFALPHSRYSAPMPSPAPAPEPAATIQLRIADLLDALCTAVDTARETVADDGRWLTAVDAAWDWLLQQDVISYNPISHALHVPSASTHGRVYVANGACQCQAFAQHHACWHRAAARLVRRALEIDNVLPQPLVEGGAMYLDGNLVGFARSQEEAAVTLEALAEEIVRTAYRTSDAAYAATLAEIGELFPD